MNKKTFFGILVIILIGFFPIFQNMERNLNFDPIVGRGSDSGHWTIVEYEIDGNGAWSGLTSQDWCSGGGTLANPYLIENVTFTCTDGSGTSLRIANSDVHFTLYNCTFTQSGNNIANTGPGLELDNVKNGFMSNCSFINNRDKGLYINGVGSSFNLIENSLFRNNSLYGIYIFSSSNNTFNNNQIEDNPQGIRLHSSTYNSFSNNILSSNVNGFTFEYGDINYITDNIIQSSTLDGFNIYRGSGNIIVGNTIVDNQQNGINVFDTSSNNHIYKNNFTANVRHAIDDGGGSYWNSSTMGNYWDNYTDYDVDGDHIGESSQLIDGSAGSIDYLPMWNGLAPLFINGTGTNNWAWAETQDWCTGSGTIEDPYTISDYFIDGKGDTNDGIKIANSDVPLIISKITFFDILSSAPACLNFENVSNVQISEILSSDTTLNAYFIKMTNCHLINITRSNIDVIWGSSLKDNCTNITISNSHIIAWMYTFYLVNCSYNQFTNNFIAATSGKGIFLENSSCYNVFYNNSIYNSDIGFHLIDGCNNNQILSNTITDMDDYGVKLENNCTNNLILSNVITDVVSQQAVRLEFGCNNNTIDKNIMYHNGYNGNPPMETRATVSLWNDCNFNIISRNNISDNHDIGIKLYFHCNYNIIFQNTISNNLYWGIFLGRYNDNTSIINNYLFNNVDQGICLNEWNHDCKIINNTVIDSSEAGINIRYSNSPVINYNTIRNSEIGIWVTSCENSTIHKNYIRENTDFGIYLSDSDFSTISDNIILDSYTSIEIARSAYTHVTGNFARDSYYRGIYVFDSLYGVFSSNIIINASQGFFFSLTSHSNEFSGNYIKDCASEGIFKGLYIYGDNNTFYKNYFVNFGLIYDDGTNNNWNNSIIGNYYDDYSGFDVNNDYIGDNPYVLGGFGGGIDYLPIYNNIPAIFIDEYSTNTWEQVSQNYWCEGSGTEADPYVIDKLIIDLEFFDNQIEIHNSHNAHFVFSNCIIANAEDGSGIYLSNTMNGILDHCTSISNTYGFTLVNCTNILIQHCDISDSHTAITLTNSYSNIIRDNTASNNAIGIDLCKSDSNIIANNDLGNNQIGVLEYSCENNIFSNNIYPPSATESKTLSINNIEQQLTNESFYLTFTVVNQTYHSVDVSITANWNGEDVSGDVQLISPGLYSITLSPIFIEIGDDPILLELTVTSTGYDEATFVISFSVEENVKVIIDETTVFETVYITLPSESETTLESSSAGSTPGFTFFLIMLVIPFLWIYKRKK